MENHADSRGNLPQQTSLQPPLQPIDVKKINLPLFIVIGLVVTGFVGAGVLFAVFSRPGVQKQEPKQASGHTATIPADTVTVEIAPLSKAYEQGPAKHASPVPVLTLSGILFGDHGSLALINGRVVREGGLIEGAKLEKVSSDRVELSFEGKKIILRSK